MTASIRRDGDEVVIRMPLTDIQSLRVALAPCPCRATKSIATAEIRERLGRGLAAAVFQKPKNGGPQDG